MRTVKLAAAVTMSLLVESRGQSHRDDVADLAAVEAVHVAKLAGELVEATAVFDVVTRGGIPI